MPTTITGTLVDAATNAISSGTFVRFQLKGTSGIQPMVTGVGALAQGSGSGRDWFVDFAPNASGVISGSVYSTRDNAGTGAGEITVNGVGTACWYEVSIWRNGKKVASVHVHAKTSATLDIGSMTPITTTPVATAPTGDTTYLRLDGGNNPMTGQLQVRNGSASAPGLAFATSAAAGFYQQASNVIGVAISSALKWLINSAGLLFGSGQAIAFSSNADPSLAAGDSWITRVGAAIWGFGSTNGGTNGEIRLSKVNKITLTQPANGSTLTLTDGITLTALVTGSTVTGTGTTNRVPKYTTGASAIVGDSSITDNGTAVSSTLPFTLTPKVQSFTTNSTFTIPTGVTGVKVTVVAGGGAGGGATVAISGGGGASGGVAYKFLSGLTPGNTITVTIGTGGAGSSGANGGAGTDSSISSGTQSITTVTAKGGGGGFATAAQSPGGASGGVSTNGDINGAGSPGANACASASGSGGSTFLGGGGNASGGGAGNNATANTGGGGSGGFIGGSTAGGNGAAGIVIFEWVT